MTDEELTSIRTKVLPEIHWDPTPNYGDRAGAKVERVVLHTWGVHFTTEAAEERSYEGVINYFKTKVSQVSAHYVYPGAAKPNEITQMVSYAHYAWAEGNWNRTSVEIECADAIWLGKDKAGLEQLAHITGYLLHHFNLKPEHAINGGFCRHGDLAEGALSHPFCPVKLPNSVWTHFESLVKENYRANGYRKTWGR